MKQELYELTNPQKPIWLTEQYFTDTAVNTICGYTFITDVVNFEFLKKSIYEMVKSNDGMRLKMNSKNDTSSQYVSDFEPFDIPTVELQTKEDIEKKALEMASTPFMQSNEFLFQFLFFKLPDNSGGFIVNVHHLIGDSWSLGLIAKEVTTIYSELLANTYEEKAYPSYLSYIDAERNYKDSEKYLKDKAYWEEVFQTIPEIASLNPSKETKKEISCEGKREKFTLLEKDLIDIKSFCDTHKISVYNFFMAVYSLYVSRVSHLDDFVMGTPILNRTNFDQKHTMGMFISVVPLRVQVNQNQAFLDFTKKILTDTMSLFRHQKYSYQSILEDIRKRDASIPNLYNVILSYQITKTTEESNHVHYSTDWVFNGCAADELQIHLFDLNEEAMTVAYDYKADVFTSQDIANLHNRILAMIKQIVTDEAILLSEIDIVTPEEKHQILYDFNSTCVDYPRDKTIVDLFEEQVKETPDATAVIYENQKLTYRELNEKANQLAKVLVKNDVQVGDIVAIYLNKSLEVVISMFGILKAGAAFLPLDIDYPEDRLHYIAENSVPKVVLSSHALSCPLKVPTILVDLTENLYQNQDTNNLNISITPEDLMYVMYTSGSTGNPKGVMVKHKNIIRLAAFPNFIEFSENEVMVQTGTIVFDACIFEIFGALLHGFKLHILKKENILDITFFSNFLEKEKVTILFLTTGLFNQLGLQAPHMFQHLKYLLTGGDVISKESIQNILESCPDIKMINCYGPTENGSYSTVYPIQGNEEIIPIGKPITNSTAYVMANNRLCPIGVSGELWVGGDGIARGYLNNDNLTKEQFIKNPFGEGLVYKTGDLVKWLPNGNIEFLGRIDNQVKVRGFRIELSEIDRKILLDTTIKQSLTIVQNIHNAKTICSYIVSDKEVNLQKLKSDLGKHLPVYMVPTFIMQLKEFPLNINGKMDLKAFPLPNTEDIQKNIVPTRNELDTLLITALNKVLDISNVSIEDSFFDLGGDSLSAIAFANILAQSLKVTLTVNDIFKHPTICDLSDYIATLTQKHQQATITKAKKSNYYPVSSAQKRIYYASSADGDSVLYNISGSIIVDKALDISLLQQCFETLIARHEVLRTHFDIVNNEIVQVIEETIPFSLSIEDEVSDSLNTIYANFVKPFDLSKAPLFRAKVASLKDDKMLLLLDMHHIISDGTSLSILLQELCDLYNGKTLPEKQVDYKDFSLWEKEQFETKEFENAKNFWVNQYQDEIPLLNMPTTYTRPSMQSFEGSNYYAKLPKEVLDRINEISKKLGITPYMLLLSVFYILLNKYTSQDDIVIGTPIVGRELPELSTMLGMFVNTLALRNRVNSSSSFCNFATNLKEYCLTAFQNQIYPFDELVKELKIKKDTSRSSLVEVMFVYQNNGYPTVSFKDTCAEYCIPESNISKFDLTLEVLPMKEELSLRFEYCTKLFDASYIRRFASHYINILTAILENDTVKIADIDMLSDEEKHQILYEFNNTSMEYPRDKTIVNLIEEQVEKTPNNIAVVFEDQKLTYQELNEKANQLARYLVKSGVHNNSIVGIMLPRSLEMMISILAVLKSGAAYLPIDPDYPTDRINYMLEDSHSELLISFFDTSSSLSCNTTIICLDSLQQQLLSLPSENLNQPIHSQDLSYIIYTSGSTGKPKGVKLKHLSLSNLTYYCNYYVEYLKHNQYRSVVSVTTVSFDIFIFETLISLQKGLKLVIANEKEQNIPSYLDKLIEKENIEIIQTTPSRMQIFYNNIDSMPHFKYLKFITLAGEPLPISLAKSLKASNHCYIYNGYGPSETTVFSTYTDVTDQEEITIGKPLFNTQIYIMNPHNQLCPIGVPGEICISGDGVGYGYINKDNLTKKSFVANPFIPSSIMYKTGDLGYYNANGEILCLGRVDNQVKIRGLRIELSEIEKALLQNSGISNCTVVKKTDDTGHEFLCAYFVKNTTIDISNIKSTLYKSLPNYMVPQYFIELDELPYTPNGKIDKKSLPEPKIKVTKEIVVARNHTDEILITIFKDLLKLENVSIDDSLYDLGGDSLTSIQLSSAIYSNLGIAISLKDIFTHPSIQELSDYIATLPKCNNTMTIKRAEKSKYYPTSNAQKRIYYASLVENNSILYNIAGGIIVDKVLDFALLQQCFNILIARHEILRTHFEIVDNEIVQTIDDEINFVLSTETQPTESINEIYYSFVKPFDLSQAPLFRAQAVYLKDNQTLLLLDMHHIISDGTSLNLFLQELCDLYNGKTLSEKPIDYKDFTLWEKEQLETKEFENAKNFWVNQYQDEIPLLNMPSSFARPTIQSFDGSNYHTKLSSSIFERIKQISQELEITPYMLLLSVYYILLTKYTSQEDIVIGTPITGRELPELSNMLGMFVNTLALRNKVNHSSSFSDFAKEVKEYCLVAFQNQAYPFNELVNELNIKRDTSRNPLFDVMFIYQNNGYPSIDFNGAYTNYFIPDSNIAKFDLSLEVVPNDNELLLRFEYCTKLFDKNYIQRLASHYINILNAILENSDMKIADINMLSDDERKLILYDFNNIEAETNHDTFVSLFETHVKKYPNNVALICDNNSLTFLELNEKSNSLAHYLINHNVKPNDIIAIMTDRSFETIICMLAILKAGAAFVNLDPTYPIDRTSYYLKDCKAKCILKQKHLKLPIDDFADIFEIDLDRQEIYSQNKENPNLSIDLQTLSYVIYTSGSTGIPKGVALSHIGLANMCKAMTLVLEYLKDAPNHTLLSVTSTPFDIFVYEIVVPLSHGMKVVLANNAEHRNPKLIDELIRKYNVDVMTVTPSLMKINYDNREPNSALANVKNMVFGGEPLSEKFVRDLKSLSSDITIYNIYGPCEITVLSNVQNLDGEKEINIGPPILNTKIYILDNDMQPVPIGFPGEIYIGGVQVGLGYLGKEDLNREKFIDNPFTTGKMFKSGDIGRWTAEGKLQCLGRIDHQVKLRGLRIELGEIEKLLESIPEVDEAVVNKIEVNDKEALCAYYVLNSEIDEALLRNVLKEKLPYYMVPTYFMKLESMPYSLNRKVDRKALPLPNTTIRSIENKINNTIPLSNTNQKLLYIWQNVLNNSNIGINDNFFDIGGDSISAIQVQIEAVKNGLNIEYSDIFKYPTIKQLSSNLKKDELFDIASYESPEIKKILKKNQTDCLSTIHKTNVKNILVIGTTGYLGVHLIYEFLTKHTGNVYCLVRPKNRIEPQQRLEDIFTFYFGKKAFNQYKERMIIINGDITIPNMGMSQEDINIVNSNIDAIINSGALVKHYGEKKLFEDINVVGTQNIVNFCQKYQKRLLHISTISVSGNGEKLHRAEENLETNKVFSEQDLFIDQKINGVYSYTKFRAEAIVLTAISKGLDAMVLRVGNITNRHSDGLFQRNYKDNSFAQKIKAFIEIGSFPEYLLEHQLELTPVDLCAEAIVQLLYYKSDCNVLHIYNNNLVSIESFINVVQDFGIHLEAVSNHQMANIIDKILEDDDQKHIVSGIIYDLDNNKNLIYTSNISLDSSFSNEYLSKIGFSWKKLSKNYLKRCLKYFNKIGFIKF